ncbi:MAG TPA: hypothetical protein VJH87_04340, partial [Vicinamibacteria bacterium]|nr:hypothetical protein [Vicinamibacteria bacterium]
MSRIPIPLPFIAAALFAATLSDLALDFGLIDPVSAAALFALGLASFVYFLLVTSGSKRWAPLALLLGASFALGLRALGDEGSPFGPSPSSFRKIRDGEARERASAAKDRFRELTDAARSAAESLAREPSIEEAAGALDPARI